MLATTRHRAELFELSPIKAMELAAARIPGVISLAQGIPSFPTPQVIKDFVSQQLQAGVCDKYSLTIGLADLREEISSQLSNDGLHFDPEKELIITCGSIEGITASILALTEPGAEVILPSPTYVSYQGAIGIARCTPIFVPLDEDRNFDFHVDAMRAAVTKKTRAILFSNPNNPTGTVYSPSALEALCRIAVEHGIYIITDEVYKDFYYSMEAHCTPCKYEFARPWVVRACSFSKAFAMTGWRVGFLHADAPLIQRILKYHDAMVTCAPVISQYAALAALRHGAPALAAFRDEFRRRRDFVLRKLDALSHAVDYQVPRATYFVFPRIKDTVALARDSRALAFDILEKAKLALVPGVAFGPSGESHLRISFGKELSDLQEGLSRFEEYLHGRTSLGRKIQVSPGQSPVSPAHGLKAWAARFISMCAAQQITRSRPTVIAIAGMRGKTFFKRTLFQMLKHHMPTRTNALSFNTPIGLSLSILGLLQPKNVRELLLFPWRALAKAFIGPDPTKLLVVEYGIANRADAEELMRIAPPHWLILTPLTGSDANIDYRSVQEGVRRVAENVPAERILWVAGDPFVESLGCDLRPELRLPEMPVVPPLLSVGGAEFEPPPETIAGTSAQALYAAILLAGKLGMSSAAISQALLHDSAKQRS